VRLTFNNLFQKIILAMLLFLGTTLGYNVRTPKKIIIEPFQPVPPNNPDRIVILALLGTIRNPIATNPILAALSASRSNANDAVNNLPSK
jgi:hypothetical protein